jgi:drug/metabolite transporter (DMT)-like permease
MAVTALLWGAYPLVSRTAGYSGPRAALILTLAGLVPISIMAYATHDAGWPTRSGLLKLLFAGLLMGGGLVTFIMLASGSIESSIALPIVDVAMLLVSAVGAMIFFAEPVTLQKIGGIALLLAGIALLSPT